ncbi:MAG: ribonuclease P protein component [Devosiaceae bacterium]|nr:ribonuclease P protein component [Devosiaceae bacterium]
MRHLQKRSQFLNAARGTQIPGRFFVLQKAKAQFEDCGIGFTVTKRMGNSPERNRIKRRLRAAVLACRPGFVAEHDYVLIGRRKILGAKFSTLVNNLENALRQVHSNKAAG